MAYTRQNILNIKNELLKKIGEIPELTMITTFHSFLFSMIVSPYEPTILKSFKNEILARDAFANNGITMKAPSQKTFKKDGRYISNRAYKKKDNFFHYVSDSQYYCDTLSELVMYVKSREKSFLKRVFNNLNRFYDFIYVDEFQDFREHEYELIMEMAKYCNDTLFVGDFYQHSVAAKNNSGKPFKNLDDYDKFIVSLKNQKFVVDNTSLIKTRRCPQPICNFIKEKIGIEIDADNNNNGIVKFLNESEAPRILKDDSIMKLVYEKSDAMQFKSLNWSYSKGDTYSNVCVILTKNFENIDSPNFSINTISSVTKNKFYVAVTRTKGNLYFIKQSIYKKIKDKILK